MNAELFNRKAQGIRKGINQCCFLCEERQACCSRIGVCGGEFKG